MSSTIISEKTSNGRPKKKEVLYKINNAKVQGCIEDAAMFDFMNDCGPRNGTFDDNHYYSAQVIINVYLANILRNNARFAVIRRDVQFHYVENKKSCYQCCINPIPEQCIDTEEYEIALIAKSDGEGNFDFLFFDDIIIKEYKKISMSKRNSPVKDIESVLNFLQGFNTIYQICLDGTAIGDILGVKDDNTYKTTLTHYQDYLSIDKEYTQQHGKGVVVFFKPMSIDYINVKREYDVLTSEIQRLEIYLSRNKARQQQIEQKLRSINVY